MIRKIMHGVLEKMIPGIRDDAYLEALVDDAVRMSPKAVSGHLQTLKTWDRRNDLGRLDLLVLLIGGQKDQLIPAKALQHTALKLPNCRLMIWPKVGHSPQLERAGRFLRILQIFAEQNKGGAASILGRKIYKKWSKIKAGLSWIDDTPIYY